ncbi:hypothetical protein FRB93_011039, partial [Tulasnella sp. JGI-2019a]
RVSVDQKVIASTAIGRKNYWRVLASGVPVAGKRIHQCLDMIHDDMVQVWNFLDPELLLEKDEVKTKLWNVVNDLANVENASPNVGIRASAAAGGRVAAEVADARPPITIGLMKWLYDMYFQSPGIIQILMAYIVDLTAILEGILHLIQPLPQDAADARAQPLSQELIFLAVEAYNESDAKKHAHAQIKDFVRTVQHIFNRDRVFEKVSSLLEAQRFDPGAECKRRARELVH